jgi:hypothetical protein
VPVYEHCGEEVTGSSYTPDIGKADVSNMDWLSRQSLFVVLHVFISVPVGKGFDTNKCFINCDKKSLY